MLKFLFCLSVFLSMSIAIAADNRVFVQVVKHKGVVSKQFPGSRETLGVIADDRFFESTTIETGSKSFIKIKFIDNSEITLASNTKIFITEINADLTTIISLVHGRIRTIVPGKNNFYIRTTSGVVNARGSETQVVFNATNRVMSLLTFKGSAMIARLNENTEQRFEKGTTVIERTSIGETPEIRVIPGKAIPERVILAKICNSSSATVVPSGQTSFTSNGLARASLPVNISIVQLNAFFKNREFEERNIVNMKSGLSVENSKQELMPAEQLTPVEGVKFNPKTGEYAPRSGGLIDTNSSLYIAADSNIGDFDANTGDYYSPKGLFLDPVKGYQLDKNIEVKPELLSLREDLNRNINRDTVVGDLGGQVVLEAKTINEKFIRDRLTLSFQSGNQKLEIDPETGVAPSDLKATGVLKFSAIWQIASTNKFSPLLGVAFSRVGYGGLSERSESSDSKSLFSITGGIKFALADNIDLFSSMMLDQAHYANQISQSPILYQYKKIVMTRMNFGMVGEIMRSKKFSLVGEGSINTAFRKRINNQVISKNTGYNFKITPQYAVDEKKSVGLGIYFGMEKTNTSTPSGSSDQARNDHGVEIKYFIDL